MGSRSLSFPLSYVSLSLSIARPFPAPPSSRPLKLRFLLVLLLLYLAPRHPHSPPLPLAASIVTRARTHTHTDTHTQSIGISLSDDHAAGLPSPFFPPTASRDPTTSSPSPYRGPRVETLPLCAPLLLFVSPRRPPSALAGGGRPSLRLSLSFSFSFASLSRPSVQRRGEAASLSSH